MKKTALLIICILSIICSACNRTCHCYGYDGSHTYFTKEELSDMDVSCMGMEQAFYGLKYSLCEWDIQ